MSIEEHLLPEPVEAEKRPPKKLSRLSKKPKSSIHSRRKRAQIMISDDCATSDAMVVEAPQQCAPSKIPSESDDDASSSPSKLQIRVVTSRKRPRVCSTSSDDSDDKSPPMPCSHDQCVEVSLLQSQAYLVLSFLRLAILLTMSAKTPLYYVLKILSLMNVHAFQHPLHRRRFIKIPVTRFIIYSRPLHV